jgi:hypothetical protein
MGMIPGSTAGSTYGLYVHVSSASVIITGVLPNNQYWLIQTDHLVGNTCNSKIILSRLAEQLKRIWERDHRSQILFEFHHMVVTGLIKVSISMLVRVYPLIGV